MVAGANVNPPNLGTQTLRLQRAPLDDLHSERGGIDEDGKRHKRDGGHEEVRVREVAQGVVQQEQHSKRRCTLKRQRIKKTIEMNWKYLCLKFETIKF